MACPHRGWFVTIVRPLTTFIRAPSGEKSGLISGVESCGPFGDMPPFGAAAALAALSPNCRSSENVSDETFDWIAAT